MSDTIRENTWARVRLKPDCPGEPNKPHHPAEDTIRVEVTAVYEAGGEHGDHHVFALFKANWLKQTPMPPGGLGLGRFFRPDELELMPRPS
jgi:hypothetical protein